MDTSWWLALAAVVVLALVVTVVDGWGRSPRGASRRARRAAPGGAEPRGGEIWWVRDAGGGGVERPFLVLSVRGDRVVVAGISTRYHDGRAGVIALPPGAVGDVRGRARFVEPGVVRERALGDFRRRGGVVDPAVWDQVRHLGG
ncbi:type II toxin-antitoxin system PemK/MazF family toxin [Streptomyces sp. G45]|uniref:type II toxin-antitoxin system PemK/MazF family toxin n=1 Tax=Streptomyces sp. G45 TaxID=3406627 RepID=UPI003C294268